MDGGTYFNNWIAIHVGKNILNCNNVEGQIFAQYSLYLNNGYPIYNLIILSFTGNNFTELRAGVFDSLVDLEELYFSENLIKSLVKNLFIYNLKITTLDFSNNNLINVFVHFSKLSNLKIIFLNKNQLTSLDESALKTRFERFILSYFIYQYFFLPKYTYIKIVVVVQ